MKLRLLYLYRNLTRNRLRSLLTCAAVALPIVIYVLSTAVVAGVQHFLDNSAKQLRLAVTQKSSIANPLPVGYKSKIEALDPTGERIVSVCALRWIGGKVENSSVPLSTLAVDQDTFVQTFPEYQLTADEIAAWQRDHQAIVIGRAIAGQMGWKVGDRITIRPSLPPYTPMEFHVVSTAPLAQDPITNLFRLDYLQDELRRVQLHDDWVSFFFVKCATKADVDYFRMAIDENFANSQDETRTQDEKSFMTEYINQQFNLPRNLKILSAATVFVAIMAAANTMSMSFRDRTHEFATLKSMGFGPRFAFLLIQSESLLLCALGGLLGAAGPYIAFMHTPLKDFTLPIIVHLEI
ncbi:MAG TPA: FtsX-like permease family protein, partial [Phycisphaerae bacterium]